MKAKIFLISLVLFVTSCKKESYNNEKDWETISQRVQFKENGQIFELKSGKFSYKIEKSQLPFKRIVLLNSSLLGYFSELKQEGKIVGVSSPEYVFSEKIIQMVKNGTIANIGNEQKYDIEKIIALKPDAVITNYIANFENTYNLLRKNGVEIIFLDEYLEQNPLDKSRYLLLFGEILGVNELSEARFSQIKKSYDSLKKLVQDVAQKPIILTNEMYGGQWYLSGGKTQTAHFINDAGGNYILKNDSKNEGIPMSFEEVFVRAKDAKVWINAGNYPTKKAMLGANPNYEKMNVYKDGRIYSMSGRLRGSANDFFESGAVRSDLVLRDYIKMLHPDLMDKVPFIYMRELE